MTNSPVVPAGAISLKYSNTSSLLESLDFFATQRINALVAESNSPREACFSCSWSTTSLASQDCDRRDSWTSSGRAISLVGKNERKVKCSRYAGFQQEKSYSSDCQIFELFLCSRSFPISKKSKFTFVTFRLVFFVGDNLNFSLMPCFLKAILRTIRTLSVRVF